MRLQMGPEFAERCEEPEQEVGRRQSVESDQKGWFFQVPIQERLGRWLVESAGTERLPVQMGGDSGAERAARSPREATMVEAIKVGGSAALLVLLAAVACAAEGQPQQASLTKEEVVARAWKAMFGERADDDIRSIYLEGYFHGATVPNRMTVKRPNLFRNEVRSGVLVFDGKRAAWVRREPDADGRARGPELIEPQSWRHFEVDIALVFPAFFDHPSELEGVEKVNGADAYRLRVALPLGGSVTYFVDASSFLVTRRLVDWDGGPQPELWENLVDGYLDVDGIRYPDGYTFEGRNGLEKGTYENVRFNVELEDELFAIPDELK